MDFHPSLSLEEANQIILADIYICSDKLVQKDVTQLISREHGDRAEGLLIERGAKDRYCIFEDICSDNGVTRDKLMTQISQYCNCTLIFA